MAYRIRYRVIGQGVRPEQRVIRIQWMAAGLMLLLVAVVDGCWPRGREILIRWLCPLSPGPGEQALQAMAKAVANGEGWYAGAVAFCRCLLV